MAKTKNSIEPGKPVNVEAATRKETADKVAAIRKEAAALGMTETQGGFIFEEAGVFVAELNFENSKS